MTIEINKGILYNENENTLTHVDNIDNKIILLKPASRLLSLFIKNNRKLLLREQLLNDVWVDYGLKASNNNLNNYVSGLRKALAQCGAEEIIVTYPRQGFQFNAKSIREIDESHEKYRNIIDDGAEPLIISSPENKTVGFQRSLKRLAMVITICFVLLLSAKPYQQLINANMNPLGKYDLCQIYSMNSRSDALPKIIKLIQYASFNCRIKADVYYYDSIRDDISQQDKELLTFCPRKTGSPCIYNHIDKE